MIDIVIKIKRVIAIFSGSTHIYAYTVAGASGEEDKMEFSWEPCF